MNVQRLSRKRVGTTVTETGEHMENLIEVKATKATVDKINKLGFTYLGSVKVEGTSKVRRHVTCHNCGRDKHLEQQVFARMHKEGLRHCPFCRGAIKGLNAEERQLRLESKLSGVMLKHVAVHKMVTPEKGAKHGFVILRFLKCGHLKQYNTNTLTTLSNRGSAVRCDECKGSNISAIESWFCEELPNLATQVHYSEVAPCDRQWRADLYDSLSNTIIEVTTKTHTDFTTYSENLRLKQAWASEAGVNLLIATSLNDVEDIVRTLGKLREGAL